MASLNSRGAQKQKQKQKLADLGLYIRYNIFIVHDVTGYTGRTLLKNFKEEKVQGPYIQQTISPLVNLLTRLFNTGPKVFLREESVPTKNFTARQRQGIQIHISTLYSVSLRVSQSNRFLTGSLTITRPWH